MQRRAVPGSHDERIDPERGGGAKYRADIMRICNLIKDEQQPAAFQFIDCGFVQRLRFDQNALMDGVVAEHTVEVPRRDDANLRQLAAKQVFYTLRCIRRRVDRADFAAGIGDRGLYWVSAVDA